MLFIQTRLRRGVTAIDNPIGAADKPEEERLKANFSAV